MSREAILSVLLPMFDAAASTFRADRSRANFTALQSVMYALQCAELQSPHVLAEILTNVPPERYVQVLCTYQDERRA